MKASFTVTKKGTWAYIRKSVRINGKSTTVPVKKLGLLSDIKESQGCDDPRQWVIDLAQEMTLKEKLEGTAVELPFYPNREIEAGDCPLRIGGDLLLSRLYHGLGLSRLCADISKSSRAKYDLNEILKTLVMGRILFPGSKISTFEKAKELVFPPSFKEVEMYRALSLLSDHADCIQAGVYKSSKNIVERRERVIYYDCTNFFFEIEENDKDVIDQETGEVIMGLRKRGKSKESRPNPIVQMGMFMDMDGIPLAHVVFPGNESEQASLQPLEEKLNRSFGMTEYVVSTDCGLGSEENRRYNMAEGRDYICVQSLPKLKEADREMAIAPQGWKLAYVCTPEHGKMLENEYSENGIFNLQTIFNLGKDDVDSESDELLRAEKEAARQKHIASLLKDVTFLKEIIVEKTYTYEDQEWLRQKRADPEATPADKDGNPIPRHHTLKRNERIIVTYSHDFALYLRHKRQLRLGISQTIVKTKNKKPRQSQQSPMRYVKTDYYTSSGEKAANIAFSIDEEMIRQEEKLDGYYAYGTSLSDDGIDVLKIRSYHHEIEHLFRTTKTHLDARPVYLSRQDRIKSHFLICFLAMVVLKILQRQLALANPQTYTADNPLAIDTLIHTLRDFQFGTLPAGHYKPMYRRTALTDQLQALVGINANTQLINRQQMNKIHNIVNKS